MGGQKRQGHWGEGVTGPKPLLWSKETQNAKKVGRYKPQSVNLRIKGSHFTGLHPRSLVISSPLRKHPLIGPVFTSWSKRTFIHDLEESSVSQRKDQRSAAEGAGQWIRKQIPEVHPGQPTKPESLGGTPTACVLAGSQAAPSPH